MAEEKIRKEVPLTQIAESMSDDTSCIEEIRHLSGMIGSVEWQQYDLLLAIRPYGWDEMVDMAAYLESADFHRIESISITDISDESSTELVNLYNPSKGGLKNFDKLAEERGLLGIAGLSRTLHNAIKIVWFNQTRVLRVFSLINDEPLIAKYIDAIIRRTFPCE